MSYSNLYTCIGGRVSLWRLVDVVFLLHFHIFGCWNLYGHWFFIMPSIQLLGHRDLGDELITTITFARQQVQWMWDRRVRMLLLPISCSIYFRRTNNLTFLSPGNISSQISVGCVIYFPVPKIDKISNKNEFLRAIKAATRSKLNYQS